MNWKDAALVAAPFVVGALVLRSLSKAATPSPAPSPAPVVPPPPSAGGAVGSLPIQLTGPVVGVQGRTYFVALDANGLASAAANPDRVKSEAEKRGFRDVVVFTAMPSNWPGTIKGDFFVRGTYVNQQQTEFQRSTSIPFGSVVLTDVWGST